MEPIDIELNYIDFPEPENNWLYLFKKQVKKREEIAFNVTNTGTKQLEEKIFYIYPN